MSTGQPKPEDYEDIHEWAQAVKAWNERNNVRSQDIVKQWNDRRKNS